jgi:hypothetical protein
MTFFHVKLTDYNFSVSVIYHRSYALTWNYKHCDRSKNNA